MMDKSNLFQRPEPLKVYLPQMDITVFVHTLNGREYMQVIRQVREDKLDEEDVAALMVEASVRDGDGERFFEAGEGARLMDDGEGTSWLELYQAMQQQNAGTLAGN